MIFLFIFSYLLSFISYFSFNFFIQLFHSTFSPYPFYLLFLPFFSYFSYFSSNLFFLPLPPSYPFFLPCSLFLLPSPQVKNMSKHQSVYYISELTISKSPHNEPSDSLINLISTIRSKSNEKVLFVYPDGCKYVSTVKTYDRNAHDCAFVFVIKFRSCIWKVVVNNEALSIELTINSDDTTQQDIVAFTNLFLELEKLGLAITKSDSPVSLQILDSLSFENVKKVTSILLDQSINLVDICGMTLKF